MRWNAGLAGQGFVIGLFGRRLGPGGNFLIWGGVVMDQRLTAATLGTQEKLRAGAHLGLQTLPVPYDSFKPGRGESCSSDDTSWMEVFVRVLRMKRR